MNPVHHAIPIRSACRFVSRICFASCFVVGALFVFQGLNLPGRPQTLGTIVEASLARHTSTSPSRHRRTKAIDQLRIGDRVAGVNPHRDEAEYLDIDPRTWRRVRMHMFKDEEHSLWIELLRPQEWIAEFGGQRGANVYLDMYEMGAVGYAEVLEILDCPNIDLDGGGTVVTGIFSHEASPQSRVLLIRLQGEEKPTGVTFRHPYWSEDRRDFVNAGDLKVGELVNTSFGLRAVESIEPYAGYKDLLYNIETSEHVYRVGPLGTLVHNKCAGLHHLAPRAWGSRVPYRSNLLTYLDSPTHTRIHDEFSTFCANRFGSRFNAKSGAAWQADIPWQQRYKALIDFHRQFDDGAYFDAFMAEVRGGFARGQNPLGVPGL